MYSVIDLFAGAGGLSHGFRQTDKFEIKAAFENNLNARKTYKRNHPNTKMYKDIKDADYEHLKEDYGNIDVVIGGPPCQGFSNANRQKNHAINLNNMLVKRYVQMIVNLQPKAFVMENVGMLKSDVHRFYLDEEDVELVDKYKICTEDTEIVLLEKKYADQGLLTVVQNLSLVKKYLWKEADYLALNAVFKKRKDADKCSEVLKKHKAKLMKLSKYLINRQEKDANDSIHNMDGSVGETIKEYFDENITVDNFTAAIEKAIATQRMLSKAKEIFDNSIVVEKYSAADNITVTVKSYSVLEYIEGILGAEENGYALDRGVLNAASFGAPQKRMRFIMMGIKKENSPEIKLPQGKIAPEKYYSVKDAIEDLEEVPTILKVSDDKGTELNDSANKLSHLARKLRDADILYNHIITETQETAMKRFKAITQGNNFHSLDRTMKENTYANAERTQNTIYLRLKYDEPSGTVVNVRKSMWIHPVQDRAISVREAARLQTFPDSFVFEGTKDSQYQQVGNAVPPILAKAIANVIVDLLEKDK